MKKLFLLPLLLLFAGCERDFPTNYMGFSDIHYIRDFPRTETLQSGELVELNVIGRMDMRVLDSMMIVSTSNPSGYWNFFSLPDLRPLGSCLLHGNGPGELVSPPWFSQASFRMEDDNLYAYLSDYSKSRMMKVDIGRSLSHSKTEFQVLLDSLPAPFFSCVYLDSLKCLCRVITADQTQQPRFMFDKGRKQTPEVLEVLNRANVPSSSGLYFLLSSCIMYSPEQKTFVEAPVGLNYLNLYRLDGSLARTICIGTKVDDIDRILAMNYADMPYTFANMKVYERFWGVLYLGETNMSFEVKRKRHPEIFLFDWEGNPLLRLQLPEHATCFDLDFERGALYTLDHVTEKMYRYDVREVLSKLTNF